MAQQSDVIARARALHELVRAEAPRTERQRTLTAPVVQASGPCCSWGLCQLPFRTTRTG